MTQLLRFPRKTAILTRFYGSTSNKISFSMALSHLRSETIGVRRETNLRQAEPRLVRFARGTEAVGVNIPGPLGGNGQMKHVSEASCFFADETPLSLLDIDPVGIRASGPNTYRNTPIRRTQPGGRIPSAAVIVVPADPGVNVTFPCRSRSTKHGREYCPRCHSTLKNAFRPWRAIALRNYQSQSVPTLVNLMENSACLEARLQVLHWNSVVLIPA